MALPPGQARRDRRRQMQDAACSAMVPPMSRKQRLPRGIAHHFQLMNDSTPRLKTLRAPRLAAGGGRAGLKHVGQTDLIDRIHQIRSTNSCKRWRVFGGGGRSPAIQAMSGVWILAVASRIRSASLDVLAQYRRAGDTAKGRNVTRTNYPRLT